MYINGFCALGQIKRFIGALVMGATNISYYGTSIKKDFPTCLVYILLTFPEENVLCMLHVVLKTVNF